MEIICRSEAKAQGLKTYFTGKPCANNHISYRYVQSGTCAECINGDRGGFNPNAAERKEAKAQLVTVRVRCYDVDREHVAAAVWSMAVMRWPVLTQGDVDPRQLPKDRTAGTALYAFNCHQDDIGAVREIAAAAVRSHSIDVEARRAEVFRRLQDLSQ